MKYQVWYMEPSFFRGMVGDWPDPHNLSDTHVHLNDLIRSKGLQHTSMSIGDVLVEENEAVYLVTATGFKWLPKDEEPRR